MLHDFLNAVPSLDALQKGNAGIQGSNGALLGRSPPGMRVPIDSSLAEVRLEAGTSQPSA
jgi:hypothetical protein